MLADRRRGARVHVARRAELERHAFVPHERREMPEPRRDAARVDVVDDANAVAEPLRAAELQRLPDRRQSERLSGVDREVEVLPANVLERVEMTRGWEPRLRARDVEAD